ncbi:MAG: adenine methylase, partial [Pseudomonadota bacterium]|nr:adenine methylase [Pseudomonadota bacterium]
MNSPAQHSLFSESSISCTAIKPVNVASVPQRSPFRYPGGKTWFVPTFRKWIQSLDYKPDLLVEPFTGGGIISLTALFENLVE